MYNFLLICICFTVVNCNPTQSTEEELRKLADELKTEITDLLVDLDAIKQNIRNAPEEVNKTLNNNDYGVSKNVKIIELEELLKANKNKKNVTSCQHILDYDKHAIKQIFDFVFWLGINSELQEATETVNKLSYTLQFISTNLGRNKLEIEIKHCENRQADCKLTSEYPKHVEECKKSVLELEKIPNSLIDSVINDDFHKQVDEKIDEEVYPQVLECIKKLKIE